MKTKALGFHTSLIDSNVKKKKKIMLSIRFSRRTGKCGMLLYSIPQKNHKDVKRAKHSQKYTPCTTFYQWKSMGMSKYMF